MGKIGSKLLAATAVHSIALCEGGEANAARSSPPVAVNSNVLELRRWTYLFAWTGIVGLHFICAMYLTQLARLYSFLMHPYMNYWAAMVARDRYQYFGRVGAVSGLIAVLHWW